MRRRCAASGSGSAAGAERACVRARASFGGVQARGTVGRQCWASGRCGVSRACFFAYARSSAASFSPLKLKQALRADERPTGHCMAREAARQPPVIRRVTRPSAPMHNPNRPLGETSRRRRAPHPSRVEEAARAPPAVGTSDGRTARAAAAVATEPHHPQPNSTSHGPGRQRRRRPRRVGYHARRGRRRPRQGPLADRRDAGSDESNSCSIKSRPASASLIGSRPSRMPARCCWNIWACTSARRIGACATWARRW